MSTPFLFLIGLFLALGAIGMPIGFAMIVAGIAYLFAAGRDVGLASEQMLNQLYNSFVLLAVPLFIFAANVMNAGTISDRLLAFCLAIVGRLRGGLAHVNVVASLIFSGMSGSALADAAGIGRVLIDMMTREGRYPRGFAAAVTAASATIGPIIPPSIPLVLYALVSSTSVGYLFLGGIIPGLMMAAALMVLIALTARRRGFPVEDPVPVARLPGLTFRAFPALLLPVILLGGIYGGATTPTEAASVAAAYALLLAGLFYRALSVRGLVDILVNSAKSSAVIALIIAGAFVVNYAVTIEQVPNALAAWLDTIDIPPLAFFLAINVLFLLFGCFLDATTMLLVLVPLLMPAIRAMDIDPVHFGVVIVVNMMIGLVTPPYGVLLFVINGLTGIPLRAIIAEIWPFILVLLTALVIMVLVPETVLWLPRVFGYEG
ncbi:MAG: TRAP transporter large permease [Azospirillaceae bacterium]